MNTRLTICSISFLFVSLQGFYFTSIGLSPFAVIGAIFIFACYLILQATSRGYTLDIASYKPFLVYMILFASSAICIFAYQDNLDVKRLVGFIMVILLAFTAPRVFSSDSIEISLKLLLTVHVVYFYIQFISYYAFGMDVDLILAVTGTAQKGWGGSFSLDSLGNLRRLGGLFNEPGTYATFIAPALSIFCCYYSKSRFNQYLIYACLASLVLTFSTFALIFSSIIALTLAISIRGKALVYVGAFYGCGLVTVLPYFLYRFFERSQYGIDTGTEIRSYFVNLVFEFLTSGLKEFLLGAGQLITDYTSKASIIWALNDSSLFLSLVFTSGPILTLVIFSILVIAALKKGVFNALAVIIIFLSKASLFWIYTPVILVVLYKAQPQAQKTQ
ncbi:hypothetical protein AB4624_01560 [Vibrio breoganii]